MFIVAMACGAARAPAGPLSHRTETAAKAGPLDTLAFVSGCWREVQERLRTVVTSCWSRDANGWHGRIEKQPTWSPNPSVLGYEIVQRDGQLVLRSDFGEVAASRDDAGRFVFRRRPDDRGPVLEIQHAPTTDTLRLGSFDQLFVLERIK